MKKDIHFKKNINRTDRVWFKKKLILIIKGCMNYKLDKKLRATI